MVIKSFEMNSLKLKNLVILVYFLSNYSFSQNIKNSNSSKKEISILFIGNSLTYFNNLPKLIKRSMNQEKVKLNIEMVAYPKYTLTDHWNGGRVQKIISDKKPSFVILQQGPSSSLDEKQTLIEIGKKFKQICNINNTKLCYFMVWPARKNYNDFDKVIINYSEAAEVNNAILLPVGKKWKNHFDLNNKFDYYSKDGYNPSLKGSRIAANIISNKLLKEIRNK